ncbi:MAG: SPW repeat protein [Pseudomonadota bacterium]
MSTQAQIISKRWQDQLILLLGLWLFISPWVLDYPGGSAQALNAYLSGAVIAALAAFDLYKTYVWAVFVNLLLGVWVAISPWVLGVSDEATAMSNSLIIGAAVVLLALWELRSDPELHRQWAGTGGGTP